MAAHYGQTEAHARALRPRVAGGVGVKVAWVGDSRAILARYADGARTVVQALTRDHKASDVMEAARIEAFYAALARRPSSTRSQGSDSEDGSVRLCCSAPLPRKRFAHSPRSAQYHGADAALAELRDASQVLTDDMLGKGKGKKGAAPQPVTPKSPSPAASAEGSRSNSYADLHSYGGNSMEEEVGPAFAHLEEEFNPSRLGMNVSTDASGGLIITVPPKRGAGEGSNSRGNSMHGPSSTPENSRHGPSGLNDMRAQLAKPPAPASPKPASGGKPPPAKPPPASVLSPAALAATEAAAKASAQRDRRSFVARLRDPETGAMSNLRLFGGNVGSSTAMTRSIGDAGAARCCIPEPEFTTVLVPPTQARDARPRAPLSSGTDALCLCSAPASLSPRMVCGTCTPMRRRSSCRVARAWMR